MEASYEVGQGPEWAVAPQMDGCYWRFNVGSSVLVATARLLHAASLFQSLAASNFEPVSKFRCTMKLPSSETAQILHKKCGISCIWIQNPYHLNGITGY
jgi:hypothetical protein